MIISRDLSQFIAFIELRSGIGNKATLIKEIQEQYGLTKDRSIYYSEYFAVRFSTSSTTTSFSNTVLALSNLQKYDELPFLICLVTPAQNILYLANSTFLQKISHSSQELRNNNIRGSFNGSDIFKEFNGINNTPENFEKLFRILYINLFFHQMAILTLERAKLSSIN